MKSAFVTCFLSIFHLFRKATLLNIVLIANCCLADAERTAAGAGSGISAGYEAPSDAPYTACEVSVPTPAGHQLAGTLTLPKNAGRDHPVAAVITITGSGPQERDGFLGIGDYRPFRQIADELGRRGIAVLRMDDRGTGSSGGTFRGSTSGDFAEDVRAGLAWLRSRPEINPDKLAVLGYSEGAVIAPLVAQKESGLAALVLLAGVAEPPRSALHFQIGNQYRHDPSLTPAMRDELLAAIPAKIDAMMTGDPWLSFFLTLDPSAAMRRVKAPALVLTGSRDQQALPAQVPLQAAAFLEGGNMDVTACVVPGLNHLLVKDEDGFPGNYAKLPSPVRIDAEALAFVCDWLVKRLR
ncbi:alpha/beta hydrolase [Luteolibacter yonseiensis]|uniref:Alpha/beta hydrolase n=1 Tax=Luteolibacter yonseiensis TaxID=1144680 RepID=A0A934R451_9BACT|nr:alpha/beta fold hydrolase [Luteolibacter yonseiensis]MBK1816776.1 alpha/beta hydrolase [Luteolibacter yonseiensis]